MILNHLQCFYMVAKEKGFSKAARMLRIGQPAVSRTVQQLEEALGVTLLERHKKFVQLTQVGMQVYSACERIFQETENIEKIAASLKQECMGQLQFGASEPIASHLVPIVNKDFLNDHPKVVPVTFSAPSSVIIDKLLNGTLEFGLFFHVPELPQSLEILKSVPLDFKLVIAASKFEDKNVISRFIGSREVDDTSNKKFPTIERMLKDYPKTQIMISNNNLTAHKQMVLQGMGVSILPRFLVEKEIKNGELKCLYEKEEFKFQLRLVVRKNAILSKNADTYLKYFLKYLKTL